MSNTIFNARFDIMSATTTEALDIFIIEGNVVDGNGQFEAPSVLVNDILYVDTYGTNSTVSKYVVTEILGAVGQFFTGKVKYVDTGDIIDPSTALVGYIARPSTNLKFAWHSAPTTHTFPDYIVQYARDHDLWDTIDNISVTGPQGLAGATGVAGLVGSTGLVGAQGLTGLAGSAGSAGLQGETGLAGSAGSAGSQGVTGLAGSAGSQGATGLAGSAGLQGVTGSVGSAGLQGATGLAGSAGLQGVTGSAGSAGLQGVTGIAGSAGSQGVTGLAGSAGSQGVTGIAGSAGLQGSTGLAGSAGSQGTTGFMGFTGYGVTGAQGYTGASGSGEVLKMLSFESDNIVIRAYGLLASVNSITATKDFNTASTSKLIIGVPEGVQILEAHVVFTAAETVGRTSCSIEMPDPLGNTTTLKSFRPIAMRWNQTSSLGGAATNSTIANVSGTITVTLASYTAASDQKMSLWV